MSAPQFIKDVMRECMGKWSFKMPKPNKKLIPKKNQPHLECVASDKGKITFPYFQK